ncbi:MAG: hypothetical protein COV34_02730 [Candidatus Zambryskibacteria bacterium CG10_big_fil_rev_8_21_14_0_10_42_12]|uniref:Bacterial spore germination immunoglobulin-like domain-containing protein n=1 Tax=Candidatus Zambryskibacteria bacterium CG10_big_fil_rev_8_21_14_0_10_42_12 TaxID=1975115 RepID=A0A2H0QUM0_9BACT|nr:MAG: hypothetical protein COV34_02730 [Candidatus Zambryskibacteria bacterium CG10_big_fil_rev_8_21_14_0_10_42_12]
MKKSVLFIILIAVIVVLGLLLDWQKLLPGLQGGQSDKDPLPTSQAESFEDCVAEGNPVMESYPRQCRTVDGRLFTENVGNELEKTNLIRLESPRPGGVVTSPLTITGEARGYWFFEASFPVYVVNWDGLIIGEGIATAQDEWMTEDFVPFVAEITFEKPTLYPERGALILQKDNPSGLPEHDDALEVPIRFE